MKKIIAIILCICSLKLLCAQTETTDSLKQLLSNAKDDTTRIQYLGDIAVTFYFSKPDTALNYIQKAILLAKKNGLSTFGLLGSYGYVQSILGNFSEGVKFQLLCLNYLEKMKDTIEINNWYLHLVETYLYDKDVNNATAYLNKSRMLSKFWDKGFQLDWCIKAAQVEFISNHFDSALWHANKALQLDNEMHGRNTIVVGPLVLGDIYLKKKDYANAIRYYRQSKALAVQYNITKDLMDDNNGLAIVFMEQKLPDSCIYYAKQTLAIGVSNSYRLAVLNAYSILSEIYKSQHKMDSTVKYLELTSILKDSLFNQAKERDVQNLSFTEKLSEIELKQQKEQSELQYRSRLNVYLLLAGVSILLIITGGLWRRNVFKQKSFAILHRQKEEIQNTLTQLKSTQSQLIQSEKMASLGELTAGIAHEIQNPLNFVNNFSEVNRELIHELKNEILSDNKQEAVSIANDIDNNEERINHHGKRADAIVKGMLQHSRSSTGVKEPTDINALADEYLRLNYHGLRAKDNSFNATMKTDFDESISNINIIPQDIGRVLLNLYNNAFYAVAEKQKQLAKDLSGFENPTGLGSYEPTVAVSTKKLGNGICISVSDNGNGIPQKVVDKIFQPFFTTKPTGQGTGLGLSLSYDIIKVHGGEIKVETKDGEGTEFIIQLPIV